MEFSESNNYATALEFNHFFLAGVDICRISTSIDIKQKISIGEIVGMLDNYRFHHAVYPNGITKAIYDGFICPTGDIGSAMDYGKS